MGKNRSLKFIVLCAAVLFMFSCAAQRAFKAAEKLMVEGNYDEAVLYYQKALAKKPGDIEYILKLAKAREVAAQTHFQKGVKLFEQDKLDEAEKEFSTVIMYDPSYKRAVYAIQEIRIKKEAYSSYAKAQEFYTANKFKEAYDSARKAYSLMPTLTDAKKLADTVIKASQKSQLEYDLDVKSVKPISLKFKDASVKEVFEVLSKLSGINFVFDETIRDTKVTILIEEATFVQALELIMFTNKLALKVVNPKNVIVYPDNKQKKKEYEETYIKTFFLKYGDAKKIINTLRSLIEARQLYVNEETNAIILRADTDSIELAEKIIEANDIPKAEVVIDLEFLEVSKNDMEKIGLDVNPYQIQAGFGKGSSPTGVVTSDKLSGTLVNIRDLEVAKLNRNILFTLPSLALNFMKQSGITKILANPQLRALDNSKASVHVGDRVPVITVTVSGVDQRSENVQYVDVGVKFNAEPKILSNDEVELKIDAEVSNIVSQTQTANGTTVYRIGTRNAKTVLRLKDGETTVIGGLVQTRVERTKNGIIFLSDIPLIGSLFTSYTDKDDQSDIFISITPHIAKGIVYPSVDITKVWSGTEDRMSSKPALSLMTEGQNIKTEPSKEKQPVTPTAPVPTTPTTPTTQTAPTTPVTPTTPPTSPTAPATQPTPTTPVVPTQPADTPEKSESTFSSESAFAGLITPDAVSVGEAAEIDIIFSGLSDVVGFEINGYANNIFIEPVQFLESALQKAEGDIYQWQFDSKTGSFSIKGSFKNGLPANFSAGRIEIKGKNKVGPSELANILQSKVRTRDGKVHTIRGYNAFMEIK